jgi:acyl-homoserine-lactone acylase
VAMCRSFPGGLAPTSSGKTIPVGDSCKVLAAWNGRENPTSRGAVLFAFFWGKAVQDDPWSHPFQVSDPVHTPYGLNAASTTVQQDFGDALYAMTSAHLPYNITLGQVQYVLLDGHRFPMPGGPADPNGELNDMNISPPGAIPSVSSTYIQAVTWTSSGCPQAATVMTYSESANPDSRHYDDQTRLFSHRQWVTAWFSPAQVAAHAVSTTVVSTRN